MPQTLHKVVDPLLKNIGQHPGLEIWHINNFTLEKLPKEMYGTFYSGDSYIILHTKYPGSWHVHFWLGRDTTIDERGTAAAKTVEVSDALNGMPTHRREVQDHESAQFLSYFKDGIRYLEGGAPTGFAHVTDMYDNWKPKLFHCKGKRNVRCKQVECSHDSLNLGDVFILDCGLQIYVWMPPESGRLERIKGMSQAKNMRDVERAGRPKVHILDSDWDTNEDFWNYFGGLGKVKTIKSAEAGGADENFWRVNRQSVTLWRVCDESGKVQFTKVSQGNFKSNQLESKDAFILDAANGGLFVWIGKGCTMDERKAAMQWAEKYLKQQRKPDYTQVIRVLEGAEPSSFTQWASDWQTVKSTRDFKPRLYQCSDQSGKLIVEEIAQFTQEDLDGDDVMILDARNVVYVWVGAGANVNEKKHAQDTARKYLETDAIPRHKAATIETMYQGTETPAFKKLFKSWNDELWASDARSYENMRKLIFSK